MSNPYRVLFSVPGARVFVAAGFVGRMSMSMLGIGIVLMVSAVTGSYGTAGSVSALCSLAYAAASPVIGRLIDRFGQAAVLPPVIFANTASMIVLILCGQFGAPTWTLFASAAAVGLTSPSIGAFVRARWSHLLGGTPHLHAAFSFESVADEVIFVTGPMLVTALSTGLTPASGLIAAAVCTLGGGLVFAAQKATQPPPGGGGHAGSGSALANPGVPMLAVVFLGLGVIFGSIDVTTIAFAQEQGHRPLTGLLLGCYAAGSAAGGLYYGARAWRTPLEHRFRVSLALLVVGLAPFPLVTRVPGGFWAMLGVIFFSGLAISPTIISGYGLVERSVPTPQLTEGLTWMSTAIGVGVAAGATVAGHLVDSYRAPSAYLFPLATGVAAVGAGLLAASRFRKPGVISET